MSERFVWITDVHSTSAIYTGSALADAVGYINGLGPLLVMDTGDMTDAAIFTTYVATVKNGLHDTLYTIPGNHEEGSGPYTNYDAAGLLRHFAVDVGNFRLIGLTTMDAGGGYGSVAQSEIDYLDVQLATLGDQTPIVVTHYPADVVTTVPGFVDLVDLCVDRGVRHCWGGHDHAGCVERTDRGVQIVRGGSLERNGVLGHYNDYGGLMVCDLYDDRIEIDYRSGRTPWQAWDVVDYPAYTPIVVRR